MHKFIGNTYTNYSLRADIIAFSNNSPHSCTCSAISNKPTTGPFVLINARYETPRVRIVSGTERLGYTKSLGYETPRLRKG